MTRYHPVPAAIAAMHGFSAAALVARSRRQEVVEARAVAVWVLFAQGFGWSAIGRLMQRDHSTVAHAWRMVEYNPQLKRHARDCQAEMQRLAREAAG
jgi:chromosomal replication initiation ATPase DnaA